MGWAAFWHGVASIFDLGGSTYRPEPQEPPPRRTDAEALAGDWDTINRDGLWKGSPMSRQADVQDLRAALAKLPDEASCIIEDSSNLRYEIVKVYAIGTRTDGPALVIQVRETPRHEEKEVIAML